MIFTTYTTQAEIRAAFWKTFPKLPREKITNYSGNGKMHCTDTRCAFADWVDFLSRSGEISQKLAQNVTL
jgi:hypothetical protein